MKRYITLTQVARLAGCSYQTAWRWSLEGKLDVVRNAQGRVVGVDAESAQKMIDLFKARRALAEQTSKGA